MVNGIGGTGGSVGRAAIEAALKGLRERAAQLNPTSGPADGPSFASSIEKGIAQVDGQVRSTDNLPAKVLHGEADFHEVAAQLKQSELSFEFAMQVRNKLIDAYREVMRMGV